MILNTDHLYRLNKKDLPRAIQILCRCFEKDPLYQKLIPQDKVRLQALPSLFDCDVHEMYDTCDVLSNSPEMKGLIILDDETESYNPLHFYATGAFYTLKTDMCLIRGDLSLGTLLNFFTGRKYLNSEWLERLKTKRRIHIIYLAVDPQYQGTGIAHRLLGPVLDYADQRGLLVTLETHNPQNLKFYTDCGFSLHEMMRSHFDLVQYCMVREPKSGTVCQLMPQPTAVPAPA
ncbi:GNAT family N-acetyltransferase [Oscillospiraceae bacterium LTW-04]|nr:GNAT family N-acetyltransferase [Oscillospiraceae bacterium MB24-C1]